MLPCANSPIHSSSDVSDELVIICVGRAASIGILDCLPSNFMNRSFPNVPPMELSLSPSPVAPDGVCFLSEAPSMNRVRAVPPTASCSVRLDRRDDADMRFVESCFSFAPSPGNEAEFLRNRGTLKVCRSRSDASSSACSGSYPRRNEVFIADDKSCTRRLLLSANVQGGHRRFTGCR